eukprot:365083-Chlamydomonas_euryale.AAC.26
MGVPLLSHGLWSEERMVAAPARQFHHLAAVQGAVNISQATLPRNISAVSDRLVIHWLLFGPCQHGQACLVLYNVGCRHLAGMLDWLVVSDALLVHACSRPAQLTHVGLAEVHP